MFTGRIPHSPWGRRWWYYGALGVLGLVLLGAGQPPSSAPPPSQPSAPEPMDPASTKSLPQQQASPMDEPVRLIHEAQQAYQNVRDYACLLIKRERINGVLPNADAVMEMKVRTQPFSVYLRFIQPRTEAGQEVCYVAGRNDGKMRVRPKGVLGSFAGFVSLDPNDPRARQTSKRSITEAGIGNMIERFARAWENERRQNLTTQVRVAEYEYNRRRCTRVETIHPDNGNGHFLYYRDVVYFDKETHLPIRLEFYDWPRQAGDSGQLVEVYSFANMRLNVGLGDDVFNH
ncbi:MAG TPA: DUF1571 domain-containing protein [Gemmataceae bacterium]|nr:DUF1571 domain-containing protein [Gemmataceae bacterium]